MTGVKLTSLGTAITVKTFENLKSFLFYFRGQNNALKLYIVTVCKIVYAKPTVRLIAAQQSMR